MMRNDLLQQISSLPSDADIGIEVGGEHVDIAGLAPATEGGLVVLRCHLPDVLDMLAEWGIPKQQREQIASAEPGA
jgi:hypothetical protein